MFFVSTLFSLLLAQAYGEGFGVIQHNPATFTPLVCTGGQLPTWRATGGTAVTGGTTAISPTLPTGTVAGDLLLMFCESANNISALSVSGWDHVPGSPVTSTGSVLSVFYKVAVGSDETTTNDSGDHQICRIVGITTGTYCSVDIFGEYNSNTQASTTSISISGADTTVNNGLVFHASAGDLPNATGTNQFGTATNSNLGSLTERIDGTNTAGNGGSVYAVQGSKVTAGTIGATTLTAVNAAVRSNLQVVVNGDNS